MTSQQQSEYVSKCFSMAEVGSKCTEGSSKFVSKQFDGDWRLESLLTMGACLLSRENRVVL